MLTNETKRLAAALAAEIHGRPGAVRDRFSDTETVNAAMHLVFAEIKGLDIADREAALGGGEAV